MRNVGHGDDWGRRRDGSAPPFKKTKGRYHGHWWLRMWKYEPGMGRIQAANKIQGLYRIYLSKRSTNCKMLEPGLLFLAACKVARMTEDPGTLNIGEYNMK